LEPNSPKLPDVVIESFEENGEGIFVGGPVRGSCAPDNKDEAHAIEEPNDEEGPGLP